eukprot:COSAG04_NODE_891_length_9607_cov_13.087085_10_plen_49_part_00
MEESPGAVDYGVVTLLHKAAALDPAAADGSIDQHMLVRPSSSLCRLIA